MTDEAETQLINRVVAQVAEANKPKGWAKASAIAVPLLGILWSIVAVAFVPWVTWVTMSVIRLEPDKPRVLPTDYLMADSVLRDQMRTELKQSFDDLADQQTANTKELSQALAKNAVSLEAIRLMLAKKGISE